MSDAEKIKHLLGDDQVPWRKWMLKVGDRSRTVTVRLSEIELINIVTETCPLLAGHLGPFCFCVCLDLEIKVNSAVTTKNAFLVSTGWRGGKLFLFWLRNFGPYSAHEAFKKEQTLTPGFLSSLVDKHISLFYSWMFVTLNIMGTSVQFQMCLWSLLMEQRGLSKTGRTWLSMHAVGASNAPYRLYKETARSTYIQELKYQHMFAIVSFVLCVFAICVLCDVFCVFLFLPR